VAARRRAAVQGGTKSQHAQHAGLWRHVVAGLGERHPVPAWTLLLGGIVVVLLAVYLMVAQRRSDANAIVPLLPPVDEAMPILAGLSNSDLYRGNSAEVIQDGAFFDAILADIARAKHHVNVETYVWWKGDACVRVIDALCERARAGVEVRLLVDAQGSRPAQDELFERLRAAGGHVERYRPFGVRDAHAQNYRDHRKAVVVDGEVAYAFGHGFAEEWTGHGQDDKHWRDTAVRLQGPVVNAIQSAFAHHWCVASSELLTDPRFFPEQPQRGPVEATVAVSGSGDALSDVQLLYELAMATARRELWIQNPYFAPDEDVIDVLVAAADRGVDVRVMGPGAFTDARSVQHSSHRAYARLLQHGVRIFENQRTFPHQKVMIVDGAWSHVGSTNLDVRSLEMSDEISVGLLDAPTAHALREAFLRDMESCREIRRDEWEHRPVWHRLVDLVAHVGNDQL
jgi:cardiolipin synthase